MRASKIVYVDEPVQLERTAAHPLGAGVAYLHQNARADVCAVTDASGAVVERRTYDDFGQAYDAAKQPVAGSAVGNPYGFQGRRLDPETGLLFFRARYYSPETGRFLQRDPVWDAGSVGGQYTFVGNGPVSRVDPLGLDPNQSWGEWFADQARETEAIRTRGRATLPSGVRATLDETPAGLLYDLGYRLYEGGKSWVEGKRQDAHALARNKGPSIQKGYMSEEDRIAQLQTRYSQGVKKIHQSATILREHQNEAAVAAAGGMAGHGGKPRVLIVVRRPRYASVDDYFATAAPGGKTKGRTTQYVRCGGVAEAEADFLDLVRPSSVVPMLDAAGNQVGLRGLTRGSGQVIQFRRASGKRNEKGIQQGPPTIDVQRRMPTGRVRIRKTRYE